MLGLQASYSYAAGKTGVDELIIFSSIVVQLFFVAASNIQVEFDFPFAELRGRWIRNFIFTSVKVIIKLTIS